MDLVSRLKEYITKTSIPVTQFADICGIARPTLSQLLNGRNKKVSDEIIAKIHASFPALSVYWLMFGEGEMEVPKNIEVSEGKNVVNHTGNGTLLFDNQDDAGMFSESEMSSADDHSEIIEFFDRGKYPEEIADASTSGEMGGSDSSMKNERANSRFVVADEGDVSKNKAVSISVNRDEGKRISNIVVFYSDNSFQSFYPI